ncbi:hypothetical protein GCM10027348_24080 [Hymenobacter tenuis]
MLFSLRTCAVLFLPFAAACSAGESNKDPVAEAKFQNEKRIGDEAITKRQIQDAEFVVGAASRHMQLLETSQLAQRKATSPDVRLAAQNAITQFNGLQQELRNLAQQKNLVLPTGLGADQAQQIGELTALNGAAFDQKYTELLGRILAEDEDAYDDLRDDAYDGDIRAHAARYLPLIQTQTKALDDLSDKLKP